MRFVDDRSPHVDRFGALLALTAVTLVTLSLTGLSRPGGGFAGLVGSGRTSARSSISNPELLRSRIHSPCER
jgi:hypothetical protein